MSVRLSDLCQALEIDFPQGQEIELTAIAEPGKAGNSDLTFVARSKFLNALESSAAAAVLVKAGDVDRVPSSMVALVVSDPYLAYAKVSHLFSPELDQNPGRHPSAVISNNCQIDPSVRIGPNVVIEDHCVLGAGVQIGANTILRHHCEIGEGTRIDANVTLYHGIKVGSYCRIRAGAVIGSDGFGYAPDNGGWAAISQNGSVVIRDRVELGANVCIDRGAIDDTVIESDVIIDNLVHLAHNVRVGQGSAIAGQTGVAGSTAIGARCTFGGQVGVTGHITIADDSHFAGKAMVTKGTREGGAYASGLPLLPQQDWRKAVARFNRLEALESRLKELEEKLARDS